MGNLGEPEAPTGPDLGAQTAVPLPLSVQEACPWSWNLGRSEWQEAEPEL